MLYPRLAIVTLAAVFFAGGCDNVSFPPPSAEEQALAKAHEAQKVAVIAALARRNTAESLLTAAARARVIEDAKGWHIRLPAGLDSQALLVRATALAGDDAKFWYAAAAYVCPAQATSCIADQARARLQELDPDNAAVDVLEFLHAAEAGRHAEARAALEAAARAPAYRDYHVALRQMLLRESIAAAVPLPRSPDATVSAEHEERMDLDWWSSLAFFILRPDHGALLRTCDPERMPAGDAALRETCRAVGERMADGTAGINAKVRGLVFLSHFDPDPARRAEWTVRRREMYWLQLEGHPGKAGSADDYEALTRVDLDNALAGMDEVERARRMVAARGVTMPADYRDATERSYD
jgi:hypothetical protein